MKASELRLGNWTNNYKSMMSGVYYPVMIVSIGEKKLSCLTEMAMQFHGVKPAVGLLADFFPIPLTEEWLIKLGLLFKSKNLYGYFEYDFPYDSFKITYDSSDPDPDYQIIFEGNGLAYVKYVHQLQNLYFALTGEELTIKEPAV